MECYKGRSKVTRDQRISELGRDFNSSQCTCCHPEIKQKASSPVCISLELQGRLRDLV